MWGYFNESSTCFSCWGTFSWTSYSTVSQRVQVQTHVIQLLDIFTDAILCSIILGVCSIPLIALYPLMKRFTYWPQAFLGTYT